MILFIDDEPRYVSTYIETLADIGYEVEFVSDVNSALEYVTNHRGSLGLIIMDVMMAHGRTFSTDETQRGRRTGVSLYRRIRELEPRVPVFILTNVSDPAIHDLFAEEQNVTFLHKYEVFPSDLADNALGILPFVKRQSDMP